MSNLTRDLYIPLLDLNALKKVAGEEGGEGYDWARIDKSTIFALAFNPQEETYGYIDTANDTTEVRSYQPELPQEIILDNENPIYKYMHAFAFAMPTGSNAKVPCMLVTPSMETGKPTEGRVWDECIVSPGDLNTVDGKISFTLKLNGAIKVGTVANEDGKFNFSEVKAETIAGNIGASLPVSKPDYYD